MAGAAGSALEASAPPVPKCPSRHAARPRQQLGSSSIRLARGRQSVLPVGVL